MNAATLERTPPRAARAEQEAPLSYDLLGGDLGDPYMALANARDVVASRIGVVPELAPFLRGLHTLLETAHDAMSQYEDCGDSDLVEPARSSLAAACAVIAMYREAGQYDDTCLHAAEMLMQLAAFTFAYNHPEAAHA